MATIRVGAIPPYASVTWPLLIAQEEGFLADEQIEVEAHYGFGSLPLLAGGELDVTHDGAGLSAAATGKDILFIGTVAMKATVGVLGVASVSTPEDLEGKAVAVSQAGSNDEFLIHRFLADRGVDVDAVTLIPVDEEGSALVQMESGQIAAGKFTLTRIATAAADGYNVIATPDDLGAFPWNIIQTTRRFADENGDVLTRYLRALQRAVEFLTDPANRDKVIEDILAANDELEQPFVEASYDALTQYELYDFGPLTEDELAPAVDYLDYLGQDTSGLDLGSLIDNSYLEGDR